jgi:peptidoglycan hydrolase-like protein with peptidoglycan-binding domain
MTNAAAAATLHRVQVKSRSRPVFEITRVGPYASRAGARRRRRWPWAVGLVALAAVGALAFAFFAWPRGGLVVDANGLARVVEPSFGGGPVRISVRTSDGKAIPVSVRAHGVLWPTRPVAPGTRMQVEIVYERPGWVGWIAGRTQRLSLWVTAPRARVAVRWLQVKAGAPVSVRFDRPVREVQTSASPASRVRVLPRPRRTVVLGRLGEAGSIGVSAAPRAWEQLPAPVNVTWFPPGGPAKLIASPAPGSRLGPDTPLRLTFSEPVEQLFHGRMPWAGKVPGTWRRTDAHTLLFSPHGFGFGVDTPVRVRLPAAVETVGRGAGTTRLVSWTTPTGSQLRLQQLLAELGYLPLRWHPATTDAGATVGSQLAAAVAPPQGRFTWRYANTPSSLVGLWRAGAENSVSRGAIMAFESDHGLIADGSAGRGVWQALIAATLAGSRSSAGYSYVIVHRNERPQTLTLWHDGQSILTTPANTGIPAAPTVFGTFPVYARFTVTTMKGTNPDGTRYSDPGIPWVSYFNGGDAIHGFTRASYGSPQSLGCVELPASEAARVWPYTPIGTLVTVTS